MREHLAVLRLPPEREIEIVEELALHMKTAYEAALADGLSEAEAVARAVRGYDWQLLECELSRAERPPAARALQPSLELIERKGRAHAGAGHWREYGDLQRRQCSALTAFALCATGTDRRHLGWSWQGESDARLHRASQFSVVA